MKSIEKHGHSPRTGQSAEYMIWNAMLQRCQNPSNKGYANYGGRGITVCDRWSSFLAFLEDMGPRPAGRFLDRIDNDKGYCPENCAWATREENNNNRRNNILITHNGETKTLSRWSRSAVVTYRTFHKRVLKGWPMDLALTKPSKAARQ